jgi:hypothetical protein
MVNENFKIGDNISAGFGKSIKDGINLCVNMHFELFDKDGNLKDVRDTHNAVTDAGKAGLMDQILGTPTLAKPGWMELGTGTGGTTLLTSYIVGSRVVLTSKTRNANVVTTAATWTAGVGTGAITEAGLFDIATANTVNLWCYGTFAVINKGASDSLTLTWTLTAS